MQQLGYLKETPSQTAGPYVHIGLTPNFCDIAGVYDTDLGIEMVNDKTLGERITVTGRIFDGAGALVRDAVIEIWQADSAGLYNSPSEMRGAADIDAAGDDPEGDVRGLSAAVLEGDTAGLDRLEGVDAVLGAGRAAAPAGEIGIGGAAHFR
ncbi:hypothetical protein ACCT30_38300, partial [Rhizobium ruizarguesonis]